ncbi:MAG: tRNA adenosine(34) deaminase TadA [Thermodesulfobacteriota bacterium]|nr:tRNA adenosine(34) deaminase TadA [Thermodesulfobacteriota bacterium]
MDRLTKEVQDRRFMHLALEQAWQAEALGEVPIGALLVIDGRVIAAAGNRRELWQDPTAHAELIVLREAAKRIKSWRLDGATMYVTLEPCVMCMGGIILARIPRLVYGARDPKGGAVGSLYDFSSDERFNHSVAVSEGVLAEECGEILTNFFRRLRQKKKAAKVSSVD